MTDKLLLLVLLGGVALPLLLFFRERRGAIEYIVLSTGVLVLIATLAILMLQRRSESLQTAFDASQQPGGAAALLLPSTSTETRSPLPPSATPEEPTPEQPTASPTPQQPTASPTPEAPTASPTIVIPTAAEVVATAIATPAPSPTEEEVLIAAPEVVVSTVRVGAAKVRREPDGTSPIVGYVSRDDEVVVLDFRNGWYLVRMGERHKPQSVLRGGQGWISGELISVP